MSGWRLLAPNRVVLAGLAVPALLLSACQEGSTGDQNPCAISIPRGGAPEAIHAHALVSRGVLGRLASKLPLPGPRGLHFVELDLVRERRFHLRYLVTCRQSRSRERRSVNA